MHVLTQPVAHSQPQEYYIRMLQVENQGAGSLGFVAGLVGLDAT